MNSDKNTPKLDLRSMYAEVKPDPWAVTRLKARLRQESKPSFDEIVGFVFRRYVLVASIILLALTIVLEVKSSGVEEPQELLTTWFYGEENPEINANDLPEYLFLTETLEAE
jgi:hypothetical protein